MAASTGDCWSREDVVSCCCSALSYRHVHCKCYSCQGRAVSRKTELRHWRDACLSSTSFRNTMQNVTDTHVIERSIAAQDLCLDESALEVEDDDDGGEAFTPPDDVEMLSEDEGLHNHLINQENEYEDTNPLRRLVVEAILKALCIMENSGTSIKTFEDILDYGKTMLFTSISPDIDTDILSELWPKTWTQAQTLLKEEGFSSPKEYYVCICREEKETTRKGKTVKKYHYSGKWSVMDSKEEDCPHCGNHGYIKYYYLGIQDKLRNWFRSPEMCHKMFSHWKEKDHWLNRNSSWPNKKELWDGDRWRELQWFWNPDSTWLLPTRCPECQAVISSEIIAASPIDYDNNSLLECPECLQDFSHKAQRVKGSPLNLAFLGHWDAWQPFKSTVRSCGSFEISIANMYKKDRAHIEEVYVIGFVPCSALPNGVPEVYDPFLFPLMDELVDGFIDGFQVTIPENCAYHDFQPNNNETVRVLMLCWTGDHPGQCEIGKCINQGKCPCRRCKLFGQQSGESTHYYYGNNRYHLRFPWDERNIKEEEKIFYDLDNETRKSVRKNLSSQTGFTGTSILHRYLFPLYGFDILHHMVYDVFHTVPLNLCKNQVQRMVQLELIDTSFLDEQLNSFPWTSELRDGRIPTAIGKEGKGLGHWKAESYQKFSFPFVECISDKMLKNPGDIEIMSLVSRFTELHFYSGRDGWTDNMVDMHQKLAQRLNVKIEESQGLEMCTISVHNMLHIHEDIKNFASTDNYWCAVFERAVKEYTKHSTNCKEVEGTFAKAECRREYLKSLRQQQTVKNDNNKSVFEGSAKSAEKAKESCITQGYHNSLLIGTTRSSRVLKLTDFEHEQVATVLSLNGNDVSRIASSSKRCFLNVNTQGFVLQKEESVIADDKHGNEFVVQAKYFFSVKCKNNNEYKIVVKGIPMPFIVNDRGEVDVHYWSGLPRVSIHPDSDEMLFLSASCVKRKIMLVKHSDTSYIVADYARQLKSVPYDLIVPVYPEKDDMIMIQGESQCDTWYGKVLSVNFESKTVDVYFFVSTRQNPNKFVRESFSRQSRNTVSFDCIIGIANGHWHGGNAWQKV